MTEFSALTAISPIDGRYQKQSAAFQNYFSEFALIRYRVLIEIEYFISLSNLKLKGFNAKISAADAKKLRNIYNEFSVQDALEIKKTEAITNHDVKAVEYFVKSKLTELNFGAYKEFVHFGLTSQDINNTAIPLSLKHATTKCLLPKLDVILTTIKKQAKGWKDIPMLARTHGQPASPTKLGKEWLVFYERLTNQLKLLKTIPFNAKFGGATGNFNAHHVAYPKINWPKFGDEFCSSLTLQRLQHTTQIEHYDNMAALFDTLKRINNILIDFCRDVWQYISMDYFKQQLKKGEVGSSAMPHKVNPIDFENAEGNLGIANAFFEHLAAKLPISRLQRDLTDSTVLRNIGVPYAHTLIALNSIEKGLNKLLLNQDKLNEDLENNWAVVAEGIQTILRREGFENPYETLKDLTRTNKKINKQTLANFIKNLSVSESVKKELLNLTPQNYTGT
ncbi:MAG: adenylosuccinate lyase [Bacteroidia bacterium]